MFKLVFIFLFFYSQLIAKYPIENREKNGYVTAHLQGQLGNQMFQIATAVAYALDHGCKVVFPNLFRADSGYTNAVHVFHRLDISPMPEDNLYLHREEQYTHYTIYSPIPFEKGKNIALIGFYQTPNYFKHHADYIRQLFAPSEMIKAQIFSKYGDLLAKPTVALHIRTFINDGRDPNKTIGTKGWKYFQTAMSYFSNEYTFLIFSDNITWVKQNFPSFLKNRAVFIEGNDYWIDFYAMSFCNHQILPPESTFSWWAAWLNTNQNKKVIAPHSWAGRLDAEIIPPEWIKINMDEL